MKLHLISSGQGRGSVVPLCGGLLLWELSKELNTPPPEDLAWVSPPGRKAPTLSQVQLGPEL